MFSRTTACSVSSPASAARRVKCLTQIKRLTAPRFANGVCPRAFGLRGSTFLVGPSPLFRGCHGHSLTEGCAIVSDGFPGALYSYVHHRTIRVCLGRRVRALFPTDPVGESGTVAGIGSVLLIPELLTKPSRDRATTELNELGALTGPT